MLSGSRDAMSDTVGCFAGSAPAAALVVCGATGAAGFCIETMAAPQPGQNRAVSETSSAQLLQTGTDQTPRRPGSRCKAVATSSVTRWYLQPLQRPADPLSP